MVSIETETELATRFNTSRYKVRQALSTLVQMGMLERAPRRGSLLKNVTRVVLTTNC